MNCPKCQTRLADGDAFCPNCGTNLQAAADSYDNKPTIAPGPERPETTLEPGARFANRYDIVRKLGRGGMGVVYVATDSNTGDQIALKLIHPELVTGEEIVKRLLAEGLLARQIRHPNIVAVYDVAQWEGQPYFTMQFVKGGSLRKWMTKKVGTDVPLPAAAGIVSGVLAGLAEAHRMDVVHRDLKPENVMLVGDPDAGELGLKILDFGIAKAVGGTRGLAPSGGLLGTPDYMAPEQKTAADAVGPQADLYSVSVMFYEMLTEALPKGVPLTKLRPDVPPAIEALIDKGLSRQRDRQQTVGQYQAELAAAIASGQIRHDPRRPVDPVRPAPPPPPPPPAPPPAPVSPARGILASMSPKTQVGIGLCLAVLIGFFLMRGIDADTDGDGVSDSDDACPGVAGPAPNGCPIAQTPTDQNLSGTWTDGFGNPFSVQHDGINFSGGAANTMIRGASSGPVRIQGQVTRTGGQIEISGPNGRIYQGAGRLEPGDRPGDLDAVFGPYRFHINH